MEVFHELGADEDEHDEGAFADDSCEGERFEGRVWGAAYGVDSWEESWDGLDVVVPCCAEFFLEELFFLRDRVQVSEQENCGERCCECERAEGKACSDPTEKAELNLAISSYATSE